MATWVAPILEIELVVAVMSYRQSPDGQGKSKEIEPISISDRAMGALERLAGLALAAIGLGIAMPLLFLPRFVWLLRRSTPGNRIVTVLKTGTSFVATLLMGILLW